MDDLLPYYDMWRLDDPFDDAVLCPYCAEWREQEEFKNNSDKCIFCERE